MRESRARVAIALIAIAWLGIAGLGGLYEPTETRYAEIAREMLAGGDWLLPRLNGLLHLDKPPLAYWAAALGMEAFGVGAFGARLGAVLASLVMVAATAIAARRRFAAGGSPADVPAWLLATMLMTTVLSRSLAADPFLGAAVAGYWALAPSPWALAAIGVGFLAKGPVVLVHTVLPVLVVAALGRDRGALRLLGPGRGWMLAALVALPWYLAAVARVPGLFDYWVRDQTWERVAGTAHQRAGSPLYFVVVLVVGSLPWLPALAAGLAAAWRTRTDERSRLLLAWLLVPLVFLSFSGSKLPAYLLPALPAAALLAARGVTARWSRRVTAGLLAAIAVAGLVAGPPALGWALGLPDGARATLHASALAGLALLALAALPAWRGRITGAALLVLGAWCAFAVAAARLDARLGSPRGIARLHEESRGAREPLVLVRDFNAGLPFYLRRTVPMLEVPRETRFDPPAAVERAMIPADSVAAWAGRTTRVWLFGPGADCERVAEGLGLAWTPIARWRKCTLGFVTR